MPRPTRRPAPTLHALRAGTIRLKTLRKENVSDFVSYYDPMSKITEEQMLLCKDLNLPITKLLKHKHAKIKGLAESVLLNMHKENGEIVATGGGFKPLRDFLRYKDLEAQKDSLWTLSGLAASSSLNHEELLAEVTWPVILSRSKGAGEIREAALSLIANLAINEDNHDMILNEGGFDRLKEAFNSEDTPQIIPAVNGFANLIQFGENIDKVLEDGRLEKICSFVDHPDDDLKAAAIHFLANLIRHRPDIRQMLQDKGLVDKILGYMDSDNERLRTAAAAFANALLADKSNHRQLVDDMNIIDRLIQLATRPDATTDEQLLAAQGFRELAENPEYVPALIQRAMSALNHLAENEDETIAAIAAEVLEMLKGVDKEREERERLEREQREREERERREREERERLAREKLERERREAAERERLERERLAAAAQKQREADLSAMRNDSPEEQKWKRSLFEEMNFARTQPKEYAKELEKLRSQFDGNDFYITKTRVIETDEGVAALDNAIRYLNSIEARPPFIRLSQGMCQSCQDLCNELGPSGRARGGDSQARWDRYGEWKGRFGEIIAYRIDDPQTVIQQWIIDDGIPDRINREYIMDEKFRVTGFAHAFHKTRKTICVVQFASDFVESENAPLPAPVSTRVDYNAVEDSSNIVIVSEKLEVNDPLLLDLRAQGRVITLKAHDSVPTSQKAQCNFRWQVPVGFDAMQVRAELKDNRVFVYVPKVPGPGARICTMEDSEYIPIDKVL